MGQIVIGRKGFVDLLPRLAAPVYGTGRIAVALAQVAKTGGDASFDLRQILAFNRIASRGQRVSVTYRFRTASFDLDTRGVRDIDRLVHTLATPEMARRDLMVVGFSDAQGSPVRNVALGKAHADRVASLLRAKGVTPKLVTGLSRVARSPATARRMGSRRTAASRSGSRSLDAGSPLPRSLSSWHNRRRLPQPSHRV